MRKSRVLEEGSMQAFSGIIQLRCPSQAKLHRVLEYVKRTAEKDKHPAPVSKVTFEKQGFDVYVVPRSLVNRLQRALPMAFGGKVNITKRLVTRNHLTSKDLHRLYLLFRCFPFEQGDLVSSNHTPLRLVKVSKSITALDISTGKRVKLEPDTPLEPLNLHKAHVARTVPSLQLIHPVSFQPVSPENSPSAKADIYDVVVIGEKLYLV
jgi:NMD protein affecting ribosome stability and mRNA decay